MVLQQINRLILTRDEGSRDVYACEMTDCDHRELAATLHSCRGEIVISGYPSALYEELYGSWQRAEFDTAKHAAGGRTKARMREMNWTNW